MGPMGNVLFFVDGMVMGDNLHMGYFVGNNLFLGYVGKWNHDIG